MVSLLCCGPKLAACGIVLSAWGVVMLVLLGIFFNVHSAVLIEDVPFTEEDFNDGPERIYGLYEWGGGGYWVREDGMTTTPQQHPKNTPTPQQHPKNTPTPPLSFPIHPSGPERIYGLYERVGTNCFVAAGLYLLLGGFALCQARLNKRKEYLVR
ncbi:ribonuclease kappa isoform X1 [Gallus gallus]|uniref:ribonuclease kappa isoform X1 n=1 Tax=Gallus gallus TaxID=9031 RepID=UPI001AE7EF9C|nr:ribonuclease kappa isoform X1 [Gallus gallus]